ncbi:hypothetical protein RO3G_13984 [Rhizopus delemar RA 99-880]|uniref:Uncharacterized protein n=1 Tax=Rhizopus delemar (strain RA 99-880 / ATCC MYA-4621 / FGSC 9543 / NRRL 43880) TaxID=246409 RepID=I1CLE3_RHIO9|nr:hypothetical protein RO3G_13984 [Rhizopus delemar RA 99-880]|eukprot:EIE89273.1 hypothetical protein RO3G_13984 [Rhizopus delemar RA 99-880]
MLPSCFIPNEPPKKLFNCVGMNVSRAKIEEGKLWTQGRELTYYLDPVTNEKLNKWDNPWTGENDLQGKYSQKKRISSA